MEQSRAFVCSFCAAVGVSMRYCSACKTTTYCSVACQKKDWQSHQLICGQKIEPKTAEQQKEEEEAKAQALAKATTPVPTATASVKTASDDTVLAIAHHPEEDMTQSNAIELKQESFFTSTAFIAAAATTALAAVGGALYFYLYSGPSEAPQHDKHRKHQAKRPQRR